jgi:hypothetical protein
MNILRNLSRPVQGHRRPVSLTSWNISELDKVEKGKKRRALRLMVVLIPLLLHAVPINVAKIQLPCSVCMAARFFEPG